jgi:hypothetical protein
MSLPVYMPRACQDQNGLYLQLFLIERAYNQNFGFLFCEGILLNSRIFGVAERAMCWGSLRRTNRELRVLDV